MFFSGNMKIFKKEGLLMIMLNAVIIVFDIFFAIAFFMYFRGSITTAEKIGFSCLTAIMLANAALLWFG